MRLRNIRGSKDVIASCPFVVQEPESCRGRWAEIFGNENPIHIEVGMGKGRFLMDMAVLHPEINYVGIEMYDSVLLRAVQKRENWDGNQKPVLYPHGCTPASGSVCWGRGRPHLPQLLRSVVEGPPCEAETDVTWVSCTVREDFKEGRNTGIQNR